MRRFAAPLAALVLLLVAVLGGPSRSWGAQDGTPGASPVVGGEVSSVILASDVPTLATDARTLSLTRSTFPAGSSVQVLDFGEPEDATGFYLGAFVSHVERGSLVLTLELGTARLKREGSFEEATPTAGLGTPIVEVNGEGRVVNLGEVVALQSGDSVFFENARFTLRNDGEDEAVVLNSVLSERERRCPPCPTFPGS